jgi:hypothetical protein
VGDYVATYRTCRANTWTALLEMYVLTGRGHLAESESELLYDWRSVSQYILVSGTPLRPMTRFYFFLLFCRKIAWKRLVTFPVLLRLLVTRLMSCFLDTGLGNLWEVPMEGSHKFIEICNWYFLTFSRHHVRLDYQEMTRIS